MYLYMINTLLYIYDSLTKENAINILLNLVPKCINNVTLFGYAYAHIFKYCNMHRHAI